MPFNEITAIRPSHPTGQAAFASALTAWRKMARVAETRASLATQTIPSDVAAIFVTGRTTAGDGLHSILLRSGSDPGGERVQSADGAWWGEVAAFGQIDKATAAEIRAGTADKYLTADNAEDASEEVALSDAATIAVDWSAFINATVTLGGNRTLGNPTNGEPGTWRLIRVIQDGTGSRTLAFDTAWKFAGGTAPTMTTTAGAEDVLSIYCVSTSVFYTFAALDMQ